MMRHVSFSEPSRGPSVSATQTWRRSIANRELLV
jgi:hypothetical protein